MPRPAAELAPLDQATLAVMEVALDLYSPPVEGSTLMLHLGSQKVLDQALPLLPTEKLFGIEPKKVVTRGQALVRIARQESFVLLGAAWNVMPRSVIRNPEETADQLRNSAVLGRVVGGLTGYAKSKSGRDSSDHELVDRIKAGYDLYLKHDAEKRRVTFTEKGAELLRPYRKANTGCPVIDKVIKLDGANVGLFNLGWAEFTEEYIASRVVRRGLLHRVLG